MYITSEHIIHCKEKYSLFIRYIPDNIDNVVIEYDDIKINIKTNKLYSFIKKINKPFTISYTKKRRNGHIGKPINDLQDYKNDVINDIQRLSCKDYDISKEEYELQRDIGLNDLKDELLMIEEAMNIYKNI